MEFDNRSSPEADAAPEFTVVFRALANPARLAVFEAVRSGGAPAGSICAGDVARRLRLSPSLVSHHLRELRLAKLVRTERRGQCVQCSVDPRALELLRTFADEHKQQGPGGRASTARAAR